MAIRSFRIGTPRPRGEGLRVGAVRFLPRGVQKKDYARLDYFDVWLPLLSPSRKLFAWALKGAGLERDPELFFARYAREMTANTDARQTIALLAALGRRTAIAVGCYCADESRCHRSALLQLLRAAEPGTRIIRGCRHAAG